MSKARFKNQQEPGIGEAFDGCAKGMFGCGCVICMLPLFILLLVFLAAVVSSV